ncbi:hypothetical protein CBR_g39607 [Chara braunii]|uniref:Uncharacterized protein n=1 Tax=Chara braunii TaxID=69332 RepID=A0A388K1J0_CHABU|nr:hypothetical protein CBR_g39607 [Chara braunii]|eukprot:GBG63823.1 hypothetical protein CBR_g39607 [Chara braunii]
MARQRVHHCGVSNRYSVNPRVPAPFPPAPYPLPPRDLSPEPTTHLALRLPFASPFTHHETWSPQAAGGGDLLYGRTTGADRQGFLATHLLENRNGWQLGGGGAEGGSTAREREMAETLYAAGQKGWIVTAPAVPLRAPQVGDDESPRLRDPSNGGKVIGGKNYFDPVALQKRVWGTALVESAPQAARRALMADVESHPLPVRRNSKYRRLSVTEEDLKREELASAARQYLRRYVSDRFHNAGASTQVSMAERKKREEEKRRRKMGRGGRGGARGEEEGAPGGGGGGRGGRGGREGRGGGSGEEEEEEGEEGKGGTSEEKTEEGEQARREEEEEENVRSRRMGGRGRGGEGRSRGARGEKEGAPGGGGGGGGGRGGREGRGGGSGEEEEEEGEEGRGGTSEEKKEEGEQARREEEEEENVRRRRMGGRGRGGEGRRRG